MNDKKVFDGEALRKARAAKGLSQHQLSVEAGIKSGQSLISAWETSAYTRVSARTASKLAAALDISPDSLFVESK